jgi:dihydroflavonol-4-reductase
MTVRFLHGKMPVVIDTGLNLIDVRDCAEGHLLAADHGRVGQRYILGCKNMALMQIGQALGKISGLKPPSGHIPYFVAYTAAWFNTKWYLMRGKTPTISLESVRMGKKKMWVRCDKAIRELKLPQTPPEEALTRAVHWYWQNGYAPMPKGIKMPPTFVYPPGRPVEQSALDRAQK